MKIIKTYSSEHIINDRELEVILKNQDSDALLLLDSGDYIRPKGIVSISEPEKIPYWDGYMLDKNGKSFIRDGQRIYLETKDFEEIEYKEHPKYKALMDNQLKMLSE